jgi:hypothetical protein
MKVATALLSTTVVATALLTASDASAAEIATYSAYSGRPYYPADASCFVPTGTGGISNSCSSHKFFIIPIPNINMSSSTTTLWFEGGAWSPPGYVQNYCGFYEYNGSTLLWSAAVLPNAYTPQHSFAATSNVFFQCQLNYSGLWANEVRAVHVAQ